MPLLLVALLLGGCAKTGTPPATDDPRLGERLTPPHLLFPVGHQGEAFVLALEEGEPVLAAAEGSAEGTAWNPLGPRTWEVLDLGSTAHGLLHLDDGGDFVLLTLDHGRATTRRGWQLDEFPHDLAGTWAISPGDSRAVTWAAEPGPDLLQSLGAGKPLGRTDQTPGHHVLLPPHEAGRPHSLVQHVPTGGASWLAITHDTGFSRWRVLHPADAPPAWLTGEAAPPAAEAPTPQGRFYVGPGQGAGLGWLVLDGDQATPAGGEEPIFELAPLDEHAWRVVSDTAPAGIEPRVLVRTGRGELHLAMQLSGDQLGPRTFAPPLRRSMRFPDDLLGDWTLLRPDEGTRTPWAFTRWGEQARMTLGEGDAARTGEVTTLGAPEALYLLDHDLGLSFAPFQMIRLGDDVLVLVDPYGAWDVLYRGESPAWLERWTASPAK